MSLSNKLTAVSLALTESIQSSAEDLTPSAIAALISAVNNPPMSIGEVARTIGLTHSATVRLVDRLEAEALVRRQRRIGREVAVEITPRGRRRVAQILDAREQVIDGLLVPLAAEERTTLSHLFDKILTHAVETGASRDRLCRMCRRADCECGLDAFEGPHPGETDDSP